MVEHTISVHIKTDQLIRFIVSWIVAQLITIGAFSVVIDNEVNSGTYNCPNLHGQYLNGYQSPLWGALLPLAAFVPEDPNVTDYCLSIRE